jgi:hypothetical protein
VGQLLTHAPQQTTLAEGSRSMHPADYALRRMSDARTRARSFSGVSGDLSAGLDFAGTGAAGFAAPVAVSRSASRLAVS